MDGFDDLLAEDTLEPSRGAVHGDQQISANNDRADYLLRQFQDASLSEVLAGL